MMINRQRSVRVPLASLKKFLRRATARLGLRGDCVAVCFVTEREIARWNRVYRRKNRSTDVLSFPATANGVRGKAAHSAANGAGYLGDIAIAPAVARRDAKICGRTLDGELRILTLHGLLHLMGYDHETDSGQMERREQRLRRELGLE